MKFTAQLKRGSEKVASEKITIIIGDSKFTITADPDQKLRINKVDDSEKWDHAININPTSGNEILIS